LTLAASSSPTSPTHPSPNHPTQPPHPPPNPQELTDSARKLLRANRDQLQHLVARSGAPQHADDAAADAFAGSLEEWDGQMRRARERGAAGGLDYSAQGLNMALARSNLQ
jgi:hypothetical protein